MTLAGTCSGCWTRGAPRARRGGQTVAVTESLHMAFKIRHIATRFALLLAVAAVVPLLAYGFISLLSLQRATRDSVIAGNLNVATRAAEEIRRYVTSNAEILKALSAN